MGASHHVGLYLMSDLEKVKECINDHYTKPSI